MLALETSGRPFRLLGRRFERFGRSQISLPNRRMRQLPIGRDFAAFRRQVRESCPATPGVYGMIDRGGQLIYVGYSGSLDRRLLTYFSDSQQQRKEARVARRAVQLVWEEIGHELAAQLREIELIRRFHPLMNRQGKSIRDATGYLCLPLDSVSPVTIEDQEPTRDNISLGPLPIGRRLIRAVSELNSLAGLGGLLGSPHEGIESDAIEAELHGIDLARSFLQGDATVVLNQVEARMRRFSNNQQYLAAARLRDRWQALQYLDRQLASVRNPSLHNLVYKPQVAGKTYWFVMRHSMIAAVNLAPTTAQQATAMLNLLQQPPSSPYGVQSDPTLQRIVNGWFAQHPNEQEQCATIDQACQECFGLMKPSDSSQTKRPAPGA